MPKQIDFENPPEVVKAFALELGKYLEKRREDSSDKPVPIPFDRLKALEWRTRIKLGPVSFCAAIHWGRKEGIPFGSSNRGYWYALTSAEMQKTKDYFMAKVTREHAAISYINRIQERLDRKTADVVQLGLKLERSAQDA